MTTEDESPIIEGFKGLNNRIDPTRLGFEWQLQADNVLCDDAGYLTRRPGWVETATGISDAYGARDGRLLAITTADALVEVAADGSVQTLATGITGAPFQWAELGYAVFLRSATARWAVYPDRVLEWGALCPLPVEPSGELDDPVYYPPPAGTHLAARRGQLVVGADEPTLDRAVLYFSRPNYPHEFCLERDFLMVPGRVTVLATVFESLLVGTSRAIYLETPDGGLQQVADYGALPLGTTHDDRGAVYLWTERGLCRMTGEFENATDAVLVPQLRERGTLALLPWQGSIYAVAQQTGAIRPRQRTAAHTPLAIATTHDQGVVID